MIVSVFGACGFIGTNLVSRLLSDDHHVIAIDDLFSSLPLRPHPHLTFHHGSIANPDLVREVCRTSTVSVHLATRGLLDSLVRPQHERSTSVDGIRHLAASAGRIVFASSASVYGATQELPSAETTRLDPQTPYARAKAEAEGILRTRHDNWSILRLSYVYGPHQYPTSNPRCGVLGQWLARATRGHNLTLNGNPSLHMTYVDDAVDALTRAILGRATQHTLNVAGPSAISLSWVAEQVALRYNVDVIPSRPRPTDTVEARLLDTRLAQRALGWSPSTDIAVGIARTCNWWDAQTPRLTIIIATLARPGLARLLESLQPQLGPLDEVLVVSDADAPLPPAEAAIRKLNDRRFASLAHGPTHKWGHAQRDFGLAQATGDFALFMDDDDLPSTDALDLVRVGVRGTRGPHLFAMNHNTHNTVYIPHWPALPGEIGGAQIVVPIDGPRGKWTTSEYEGDWQFITQTMALYPAGPIIHPDVIYHVRPTT